MTSGYGRFTGAGVDPDRIGASLILATLIAIPMAGTLAALGFLMSGLGLMALRPMASLRASLRFWPLLVLPAYCTLSMLWSVAPGATLRFGLQLSITMLIAIILAQRVSLARFLQTVLWVLAAVTIVSIVAGNYRSDTGALTGFYASKNAMGGAAAILALIAWGYARSGPLARRGLAAAVAVMAVLAVVLAQSVSALLALMMAIAAVLTIGALRHVRPLTRLVLGIFFGLLALLAMILAAANFEALSAAILALTGKDVTLTGRTDLWLVALDEIAASPLTGVGYQAFWLQGNPMAELLWDAFGIESRSGFHFHNTYLSNAVEIGIPGALMQAMIIMLAVYMTAKMALARKSRETDILFGLVAMIFVLTPVEVPVFFQFNLTTVLLVVGYVYARTEITAAKASDPPGSMPPPDEGPQAYHAQSPAQSAPDYLAG